jgi:hypothetical protein
LNSQCSGTPCRHATPIFRTHDKGGVRPEGREGLMGKGKGKGMGRKGSVSCRSCQKEKESVRNASCDDIKIIAGPSSNKGFFYPFIHIFSARIVECRAVLS